MEWNKRKSIAITVLLLSLLPLACTAPQYIWHQEDIGFQDVNPPSLEKKILIASRKSEFKCAIVQRIKAHFQHRSVYLRIIGIEDLEYEDGNQYSAIVLVNTAMGWTIDRKAKHFLKRHKDLDSVIVLTTSDTGKISPDTEEYRVDAISSASVMDQAEHVADKIIRKIDKRINK